MTAKILIVEDQPQWQTTLKNFLEDSNKTYFIKITDSYEGALDEFSKENFDLLITDLKLIANDPDNEGGLDLIKKVKESHPFLPTIVVTLYPTDSRIKRAYRKLGVDDFLNKADLSSKNFNLSVEEVLLKKQAFMLMPFKRELLPIWRSIQSFFENTPVSISRADDFFKPGVIIDRIYKKIEDADYSIADLTGQNANVLHELGYAHAQGKSVISITQSIDDVPEQLQGFHLIKYSNQIGGEELSSNLLESIDALKEDRSEEPFAFFKRDEVIKASSNSCLILAGKNVDSNFEFVIDQLKQDLQCQFTWEKDVFGVGHELEEIWKEMQAASYCIAYLNDREPSVYYLTGLAIGLGKDLIIFTKGNRKNPFDFRTRKSIKLIKSAQGIRNAVNEFKKVYPQIASSQVRDDLEKLNLEARTNIGDVLNRLIASGKITERLKEYFSIEEMQGLVDSLDEEYEQITGPNSTRGKAAVDIAGYFQRQGRLEILVQKMINSRPDVDW